MVFGNSSDPAKLFFGDNKDNNHSRSNHAVTHDAENNNSRRSGHFSCATTGGGSTEFSIVGPLPEAGKGGKKTKKAYRPSFGSSDSVHSYTSDESHSKSLHKTVTSILKKASGGGRPAYHRAGSESGLASTKSGRSGYTGSLTHMTPSTDGMSSTRTGSSSYLGSEKATPRYVWYGRWLFFLLLCMVAATLGYLTYDSLSNNETFLAECVFVKVAEHAIRTISENQKKKKLGMDSMASIVGTTGADPEDWPFVAQQNYETIAHNIIDVSKGCNIGYGPILRPDQVFAFEVFAQDFYQRTREPEPFPNGTGIAFGKKVAVWARDVSTGNPYHDYSGSTDWDSRRRIIVPTLAHASGPSKKLMFNMHSSPLLGQTIENMMACAEDTREQILLHESKYPAGELVIDGEGNLVEPPPPPSLKDCTMVTDIAHNKTSSIQKEPIGPGASMLQPIYPANDKTKMVGVMSTSIVWTETMADVFAANVDGIDIVLSTPYQQVSFKVIKGVPTYQGIGDWHDPKYDEMKHEGNVTLPGYFASQSVPYTIALYPSDRVYEMYSTKNPYYATVGAICVMVFTVLMFLSYDLLVRREFSAKNELLKAKRHFMRYVSHEVRTPLNSVCMGLHLMQEEIQAKLNRAVSTDERRNAMITVGEATAWLSLSRDVHNSAQSATNVLNDFLNYDKIENQQLTLELSVIPVQNLISGTVSEFVLPAQDKSIRLSFLQDKVNARGSGVTTKGKRRKSNKKNGVMDTYDIESQLLEDQVVVGDKARLSQVVRNIISNAIKFTPERGSVTVKTTWIQATVGESGTFTVDLHGGKSEALHQTGWVQIEVTDTGPGMTSEQLATVFESGVQFDVNKNQKGGGSGLGLFIAKGIIDQHNGTLSVTSDGLGQGSSFVCKLPVYCKPKSAEKDMSVMDARDESITERVSTCWLDGDSERDFSYRILVVDDAPMNRKLLTRLLMKRGHEVEMAEDGLQAYEKVCALRQEGKRYDTILMDFQMPVMDGPTSTQYIRKEGCDSFIVGITGNVLPQDVEHFKACGADGVLAKPFQVEELESMWIEYGVTPEETVSFYSNESDS